MLPPVLPTDSAQQEQEVELLRRALQQLPEEKREILLLCRFQELKYEEIAALLGCELNTVRTRVHRALQDLRKAFHQLARGTMLKKAEAAAVDTFLLEEVAMKCEHIVELLPDYLQGRLSAEQHHNVEAHLDQCADCSEEVVIWRKLSLLPVEQPGPASRARFGGHTASVPSGPLQSGRGRLGTVEAGYHRELERVPLASLASGGRSVERRADCYQRLRWSSGGWFQIPFPRLASNAIRTREHEAIGRAFDAAAAIGQRAARGRNLEHARPAT